MRLGWLLHVRLGWVLHVRMGWVLHVRLVRHGCSTVLHRKSQEGGPASPAQHGAEGGEHHSKTSAAAASSCLLSSSFKLPIEQQKLLSSSFKLPSIQYTWGGPFEDDGSEVQAQPRPVLPHLHEAAAQARGSSCAWARRVLDAGPAGCWGGGVLDAGRCSDPACAHGFTLCCINADLPWK